MNHCTHHHLTFLTPIKFKFHPLFGTQFKSLLWQKDFLDNSKPHNLSFLLRHLVFSVALSDKTFYNKEENKQKNFLQ
jgi:hypothetical protein